ncbi:MAG TPA: segregation/condensation protein A [Candidatus Sphingobacterium stercoripullorum]|nr:segregation/condensation protein A [Candidatus Sphingobacterium stercoripullorum]
MENYEIKLTQFEGPFDLLLFFIERDELNIHDIPISKITLDFLRYIEHLQSLNIEVASEFIFVASTLMRIKARMLLPKIAEEGEEDPEDLKEQLIQKLIQYKQFKEVCQELKVLEDQRHKLHKRAGVAFDLEAAGFPNTVEEDLSTIDLYRLMLIYDRLMNRYDTKIKDVKHTVVKYPYTIESQKEAIKRLIAINKRLDFNILKENSENRVQFVYNFLAILELLQQELIDIQQDLGYNNFWVSQKA